ncbi:DNA polymerase IV [Prevotella dentasini]|uniref:DNA polymerase IV n=1 Tax=Prevotella dentasini TaxID=589537 RepID=UPI00046ADE18|nr:DNA polymerase IV [Prevotella dentasini]
MEKPALQRKIIHIDMDAFFASVEQHDRPELRGLPLAIGRDVPRGVVSTASYEARPFGVRSAMSIMQAKKRCPGLLIVPPRFGRYKEVSGQIHAIFHEYTDLVEPLSIDEAFLDVTENKKGMGLAIDIARAIKREIYEKTGLTASAGVSYNKFLAKIASDYRKPDGLFLVHPDRALDFVGRLPVEKFWGVGPKTAQTMHGMGIVTGEQLREVSLSHLLQRFGKQGKIYFDFARGIDNRPVVVDHERKSVGCERTFMEDISSKSTVIIELYHTVLELVERLERSGFEGRTLTLKLKWDAMTQITRSITHTKALRTKDEILPLAKRLLSQTEYGSRPVRLMGLSVSSPVHDSDGQKPWQEWVEGYLQFH